MRPAERRRLEVAKKDDESREERRRGSDVRNLAQKSITREAGK